MLVIGRLITGTSCSLISLAVPTYIAEFSSPHIRGILGTFYQIMLSIGILFAFVLGALLNSFRWIGAICAIVPCICSLLMIPNKESPLYLLSKGREEEAVNAVRYFKGKDFVGIEGELQAMKESLKESKKKIGLSHMTQSYILKPFFVSLSLMFFQQFSGIGAVTFNFNIIFKNLLPYYRQVALFVCLSSLLPAFGWSIHAINCNI
ncbi:Facilitated trehalose transporter Tret1 [Armadillidium nasatum]|uniref:Facilitated trehalose transporter Tret1 n=1 Tax=Armadillidium nasatum TaxID=96803 RepID=A0A5N5T872_9CRUS|nr:Facilitated trehalose transporter Tret1 [Armadillidium nasatum]